jgi:hypothetical protein
VICTCSASVAVEAGRLFDYDRGIASLPVGLDYSSFAGMAEEGRATGTSRT